MNQSCMYAHTRRCNNKFEAVSRIFAKRFHNQTIVKQDRKHFFLEKCKYTYIPIGQITTGYRDHEQNLYNFEDNCCIHNQKKANM